MKALIICLSGIFVWLHSYGQTENDILGTWISAHGSGKIEIFKKEDKYFGKIVWLKKPTDEKGETLKDIHNPNDELKNRPIIGIEIFKDLEYNGKNLWRGGTVYDPKSGHTYNCQMAIRNSNELDIRAFFGLALLGKTETWKRTD